MALDEIHIELDAFEGPLDLLLYLIRRDEIEITDIPISRLAEQYITALTRGGVDRIDIELAGEFLVMAATLMEIKSRMLMPKPPEQPGDAQAGEDPRPAEDPRADLVRQLLAYKKYRDAASGLEQRLQQWESRFPGAPAGVAEEPEDPDASAEVDLEDVTVVDLARAFAAIMDTVDMSRLGEHRVADDETPIEIHAADIIDRLNRDSVELPDGSRGVLFRELFTGRSKAEAVGLFLAMLELMKQQRLHARQDAIHAEIYLSVVPADRL